MFDSSSGGSELGNPNWTVHTYSKWQSQIKEYTMPPVMWNGVTFTECTVQTSITDVNYERTIVDSSDQTNYYSVLYPSLTTGG